MKGSSGWNPVLNPTYNNNPDAYQDTTFAGVGTNKMPWLNTYTFSASVNPVASETIQVKNIFKKVTGIAGIVKDDADNSPVAGVTVNIYDAKNILVKTLKTDANGVFMYDYKYTGKPTTFTVKLPDYGQSQSIQFKSNKFVVVDFTV